jgi:trehalose 6-phosphate synthase
MGEQLISRRGRSETRILTRLEELAGGAQVIVLSNREPVTHERTNSGRPAAIHSSSGVVNAVEPLVAACGGVWVAHGAGSADRETASDRDGLRVPPGNPRYRLRRVWLSDEELDGYYRGFANEALWPLCHRAHVRPIFRTADLEAYWAVNGRFADAVCDEATTESPVVLVQDYHFALAPRLIRERLPQSTIVTFWHIPWPHWQTFEICPWRDQILDGMLGSSIIGFQTGTDRRNFVETVEHTLEARIEGDGNSIRRGGRRVLVHVYPASVAWSGRAGHADGDCAGSRRSVFQQLGLAPDTLLGVGVDRLDYTKGIEEKFQAVAHLLDAWPEFAGRFVFAQLAEPSRTSIPAYADLRERVRALAERVNRRFGRVDYCPIVILEAHHPPDEIGRFLRAADLCFVGSLHDGMNLVSKEFVRARDDERGVLVLSTFAGAARALGGALIVNPYDVEGTAHALAVALTMTAEEQQERMRRMRDVVAGYDAHRWGADMLADAMRLRGSSTTRRAAVEPPVLDAAVF